MRGRGEPAGARAIPSSSPVFSWTVPIFALIVLFVLFFLPFVPMSSFWAAGGLSCSASSGTSPPESPQGRTPVALNCEHLFVIQIEERTVHDLLKEAVIREARSAIERGQTEAAIELLRHLERELAASELEFEWDRCGRGPRICNDDEA